MGKKHVLLDVWNDFPEIRATGCKPAKTPSVERFIAEMFSVGEFYYYTVNLTDSSILNCHENALKMHGLAQCPQHLSDVIDLVHPEDIPFVMEAERMSIAKVKEIGFEHYLDIKTSYCFRMKIADGSYQLFHHQSLHIAKDTAGRVTQSVNIHTNIQHLTPVNSYIVLVSGINGRNDFHQMQYQEKNSGAIIPVNLTKREKEILHLLGQGYTSAEISERLVLSPHTVLTHRKNILKKSKARNSSELIRICIEWNYI